MRKERSLHNGLPNGSNRPKMDLSFAQLPVGLAGRTPEWVGQAQSVFFSPSLKRWIRALKVGSSLRYMPAQVCTVKPG
jgi:hypothetical protein